jgi:hypothetical protein
MFLEGVHNPVNIMVGCIWSAAEAFEWLGQAFSTLKEAEDGTLVWTLSIRDLQSSQR